MALIELEVSAGRFDVLTKKPFYFDLMFLKSLGIVAGDSVYIFELDSARVRTGKFSINVIIFGYENFGFRIDKNYLFYYTQFLSLNNMNFLLAKSNVPIIHTGVTADTILFTHLIKAGTMQENDFLRLFMRCSQLGALSTKFLLFGFNTSVSWYGYKSWGYFQWNATSMLAFPVVRNLVCKNSLAVQSVSTPFATELSDEASYSGTVWNDIAVDFSVDQYFILGGRLPNVANTLIISSLALEQKR